jgi:tellurite methyltransferase
VTELAPPSPFFLEQRERLSAAGQLGPIADLACGRGRHSVAAAALRGARVLAVDRNRDFLSELGDRTRRASLAVQPVRADLENPPEIPFQPGSCGAILVFRFLFRPLAARIAAALCPGGLLLYETFTVHQLELAGGPRNPAHLLADGELPELFPNLQVLSYWQGRTPGDKPNAVARLAARRND